MLCNESTYSLRVVSTCCGFQILNNTILISAGSWGLLHNISYLNLKNKWQNWWNHKIERFHSSFALLFFGRKVGWDYSRLDDKEIDPAWNRTLAVYLQDVDSQIILILDWRRDDICCVSFTVFISFSDWNLISLLRDNEVGKLGGGGGISHPSPCKSESNAPKWPSEASAIDSPVPNSLRRLYFFTSFACFRSGLFHVKKIYFILQNNTTQNHCTNLQWV